MNRLVSNIYWENGAFMYKGLIVNGLYEGLGKLYHKNGTLEYEGIFVGGKKNILNGKIYWPNGFLKYKGELNDDNYHGNGVEFHEDGSLKCTRVYNKDIIDATIYHMKSDPIEYMGNNIFDKFEEPYVIGQIMYQGSITEGKFHNRGTLYHRNGKKKYEGFFYEGGPIDRENPIYHSDGVTVEYLGDFMAGQRSGAGTFNIN